jgi:hypothetical protein
MRRISSRSTYFYKRLFPLLWLAIVAVMVLVPWLAKGRSARLPPAVFIGPLLITGVGYAVYRRLVYDLVDEVWDDGDALIVRNAGREDRVELRNIANVGYSTLTNPERVTLTLREPGRLGKDITFSPPRRWLRSTRNPIVTELIERIDATRR